MITFNQQIRIPLFNNLLFQVTRIVKGVGSQIQEFDLQCLEAELPEFTIKVTAREQDKEASKSRRIRVKVINGPFAGIERWIDTSDFIG